MTIKNDQKTLSPTNRKIDLSVIIVSYRGWNRLIKCLESLNDLTNIEFTYEVIVVDNKSEEVTIDTIERRFSEVTFIHNSINGGFANGCNLGAKNAQGEYLLFLNPDTVVQESEIGKLMNSALQNPSYSIISCRQVNENGRESHATGKFPQFNNLTGFQRLIFGKGKPISLSVTGDVAFPDWVTGAVIMMQKKTFRSLKGFDEDFWMYYEDVDICKRVRDSGGEIAFFKNTTIEHNHGGSSRINIKTASLTKTEVHISRHVYISKHKKGIERFLIQAFLILNNLITGGLIAIAGIIFFFIPKAFLRVLIFAGLVEYYINSLFRQSWISSRSVNFNIRETDLG